MKQLVEFYLKYCDCTNRRNWESWPFHRIYNQYTQQNGGIPCIDKWRDFINENISEFRKITEFADLHAAISKLAQKIYGIGPLQIYDTAICFCSPSAVYLHAGTKTAANAMGIYGQTAKSSDFIPKYPELSRLTPLQLEDFLCIYKEVFIGKKTIDAQLEELPKCCNCTPGVNCGC